MTAILRHVDAAGPLARLSLEQAGSREPIEVEISRSELEALGLEVGDVTSLRLRQAGSFAEEYAI